MRAQVGDEIVVVTQVVGRPPRRGRVQEILGSSDTEHFRVRWDDGHESVFFPGAAGHIVRPVAAVPAQSSAPPQRSQEGSLSEVAVAPERMNGHTSLRAAAAVLVRSAVGAVLVQEPASPPAIVSQRDLLAALANGADPDVVEVADIASSATVWATKDEELSRAAESMRDAEVSHVLVRDRNGLVGLAGLRDVLVGI